MNKQEKIQIMNSPYSSWKQKHDAFWDWKSHDEIKKIIDKDPKDFRSTSCHHANVGYVCCPDCNVQKVIEWNIKQGD